MILAEKCCFIPLHIGCVCLGVFGFIISIIILAASIWKEIDLEIFNMDTNLPVVKIVLCFLIIIAALWMIFSCLLVLGIVKNKASFVLSYFAFGIFLVILCMLTALLALIHKNWKLSISLFVFSGKYIYFLVMVHTVYDLMARGKDFRLHHHDQDVEPLAECFDEDRERI